MLGDAPRAGLPVAVPLRHHYLMTIIDAITDQHLFRPLFKNLDSWRAWLVVLKSIFALEMNSEEKAVFTSLTGRASPPTTQVEECWIVAGRRSGKSRIAALVAVFLGAFKNYDQHRSAGERIAAFFYVA